MGTKYIILSPVYNEEEFIEKTINSVVSQTNRPVEWIIINDGSTDQTKNIIEKYVSKIQWIKLVNRSTIGYRPGHGVVDAFYDGLSKIKSTDWEFIVKLDGDVSFNEIYFEEIFKKFAENARLGIASGKTYYPSKNGLILEDCPDYHARGPSKIYKRECFEQIGGLKSTLGWDTIDELQAQMHGWETRSYKELIIVHHRRMASRGGISKGNYRVGYTAYKLGYHPLYMIMRSIYRMIDRPFIVGGLVLFYGYLKAALKREKYVVDKETVNYLRHRQLKSLFNLGKFIRNK